MKVIKRDNTKEEFDSHKIQDAINKAFIEVDGELTPQAKRKSSEIASFIKSMNKDLSVERIQDLVEDKLMISKRRDVARAYVRYRYKKEMVRQSNTTDESIMLLLERENEELNKENSNKNPILNTTQRDYMAGEVSKDITKRFLLPKDVIKADKDGLIHFHDSDYYAQKMHNCDLINLEDMIQNGTVISETLIEKPHSFSTACNIATQIIAQVASSQYGGQSISLAHLAPFVQISRDKIREEVEEEWTGVYGLNVVTDWSNDKENRINQIVEKRLLKEIKKGVQTIQYQVVTLMTTNGQAPFLTIFMYLNETKNEQEKKDLALIIEEVLKQRIQGVKNEVGAWITPAFPKLIYVLEEDNITEDSKYYYLTKLSAKCSVRRLVPDYISEKVMKQLKEDNCFPVMGCRSALNPWKDENEEYKFYGRFNQGVVTINLVDVALSSKKDINRFWELLDERTELCHRALKCRHERLEGTPSNVAPILWQYGALARLKKDEPIDKLLHGGYSSISLGYAGLYECVKYMTEHSHTDDGIGESFGLSVMKYLNDKCDKWSKEENVGYSTYGSPIESTTYKFAKCLKKRFGIIEGITDRDYITNSYHVPVFEKIDAFTKLELESKFQALSKGGAISYVEVGDLTQNEEVALQVIKFIYDNIMYAELNTKSDYCMECGYNGEIKIIKENDDLIWECPNCRNRNHDTLNVARRTCGYIGKQFWNEGRTQEINERVLHIDNVDYED